MTTDNVEPAWTVDVTVTPADYLALDDALRCIDATLAVVRQLRYARPGELEQSRRTLVALIERVEQA